MKYTTKKTIRKFIDFILAICVMCYLYIPLYIVYVRFELIHINPVKYISMVIIILLGSIGLLRAMLLIQKKQ